MALLVYVDDVIVVSNCSTSVTSLKAFLHSHFKIKDLGGLRYFLRIEVARTAKGIHFFQQKYALDVLADSETLGYKPLKLPMEQNVHLSINSGTPLLDPTPYRRLIGKLLYLTITLPNLSYIIHILSQFMDLPSDIHLAAAHKVLQYVRATPG